MYKCSIDLLLDIKFLGLDTLLHDVGYKIYEGILGQCDDLSSSVVKTTCNRSHKYGWRADTSNYIEDIPGTRYCTQSGIRKENWISN